MAEIFERVRLTANQLKAVSERRWGDAKCLLESGSNDRMNGAMYLGGFVVECLLKAKLLELHPNLVGHIDSEHLSKADRDV